MRRYREKLVYKVQFIITERDTNKVLRISTQEIDRRNIASIGELALSLNGGFYNTCVLIKIY